MSAPILDACTVVNWFRQGLGRRIEFVPDERQVGQLLEFLLASRTGQTALLKPYRNPAANRAFTKALDALSIASSTALINTVESIARAQEELPGQSGFKTSLISKLRNDEAALRDLIKVVAVNQSRFPPRPHRTRTAEWHEPLFALYIAVGRVFQATGCTYSVGKATSPGVKVLMQALAFYEGHERSTDAIVEALRARLPSKQATSGKGLGIAAT